MGDAQCPVSSINKKATLANNGLLIMFARKGPNQERYVQDIVDQRKYCGSMEQIRNIWLKNLMKPCL